MRLDILYKTNFCADPSLPGFRRHRRRPHQGDHRRLVVSIESLTCVIELASSWVAYLLGDWTEELDNSSLAIRLLLGRWRESPVSSIYQGQKLKSNKYRLQLAAIPLLDPVYVQAEKARFFFSHIDTLIAHLCVVDCPSKTFQS